jgi:orotate phosphoribosyltransferase
MPLEEKLTTNAAPAGADDFRRDFISFCVNQGVLKFGSFVTKSGRQTPYFFNAGLFSTGSALDQLSQFYAKAIIASGLQFDMLFGPAYKGIVLAAAVSMALARAGRDVPFSYNRKEAKDHGEGGTIVGAPLQGRVLIIDDVMTAGTAVREAVSIITAAGAVPAAVAICLDRMERGNGELSAVQEVRRDHGMVVVAVATLDDLLGFLQHSPELRQNMAAVTQYRATYGAKSHA